MKLSIFTEIMEKTYTDRMTVYRYTETENADGSISQIVNPVPELTNIPCRLSFKSNDQSNMDEEVDRNPLYLGFKIFCNPSVEVEKGDCIKVDRLTTGQKVFETYTGIASKPFTFESHKEVYFLEQGTA